MKIAICGHSGCGKDEVARYLAGISVLKYSRSTSQVITPYAAKRLGITTPQAFAIRHHHRELFRKIGDELRAGDPAYLARDVLADGDLLVGVRSRSEMMAVLAERLVDLTVWIERDVPRDETLEFGRELADVVVDNNGSIEELRGKVGRLAKVMGVLRVPAISC